MKTWLAAWPVLLAGVLLLGAACAGAGPECHVGADCASGVCLSDGTCAPFPGEPDAGGTDGDSGGADEPADGGADSAGDENPPADDEPGPDGDGPADCAPNHDWVVERGEMPLRPGLRATFQVGLDAEVDTAGSSNGGEERSWNFSGPYPQDHALLGELLDPASGWYAGEFSGASYAARLADGEPLLGVFRIREDALELLGVVSPTDGLTRTLLHYQPPARILEFPLEPGASWSSDSTVSGQAQGAYTLYRESYESVVDARGQVATPYGSFSALRVRVKVTRTVGALPTVLRSFAFVAECFGTVVKIDSRANETRQEFTRAAEIWRLAP